MSACHCRVQNERANAWTAAGTATASHAAEWKQAHEILCALDQTSTCTVPSCPDVTQPASASGVNAEGCSKYGQHCLRITTGTHEWNDGDLTVEVTAGAVQRGGQDGVLSGVLWGQMWGQDNLRTCPNYY
jgi:hypothetical protein